MKKILAGATVLAMLAVASPAFADVNSSSIKIEVENSGKIYNDTEAKADTGGNYAGGSTGGRGGSGGDVDFGHHSDQEQGNSNGGDGGNGGDAGEGGLVDTGDANADAGSINKLNTTDIKLGGRHNDMNSSSLKVEVENGDDCGCNKIDNETEAKAKTGDNTAKGSRGGKGGRGGDVDQGDQENGDSNGGDGGDGGEGSIGGTVYTGEATANAGSVNVMNTTVVRVRN